MTESSAGRHLGLLGATAIGVGAIVGGGILALAGVAFATAGPGAILAFAANGVIAVLTALSFAEMSARFPESGGTYTFAKKVLSVRAAFMVGWVVWFASIVAAVLYALSFATFAMLIVERLVAGLEHSLPAWLAGRAPVLTLALAAALLDRACDNDLVVLGLKRLAKKHKVFGQLVLRLARETSCGLILISRRG